jgi:hypothetical protein
MRTQDYIPRSEDERASWLSNFAEKGTTYASLWDVPLDAFNALNTKTGKYIAALKVAKDPRHSPVDIAKKNAAEEEAVEEARKLYKHYIVGNDKVTDDQRIDCRLPVYDTDLTPSDTPTSTPEKKRIDHPTEGQVRIWIQDSITGLSLKPDGVHGWEARLKVCAERILHRDQMDQSMFVTHNPMVLQFDDYQLGMILSITFRYENTRGVKGPWSEIYYIIIS